MRTTKKLLSKLKCYQVDCLSHGALEDKIGDAFEAYLKEIFSSNSLLNDFIQGNPLQDNSRNESFEDSDYFVFSSVFQKLDPCFVSNIVNISATTKIESRITGGNPKTDLIINCTTNSGNVPIPISIKHTSADKVAMAEFDVPTIVKEVGITDSEVCRLMLKHQVDASAKNFTPEEKEDLYQRLIPYAKKLVTWVISGSPNFDDNDLKYPKLILKFRIEKYNSSSGLVIKEFKTYHVEEYVDKIMGKPKGKKGGFGTGLSWTYATGSKGKKIQFKG